MNRILSVGEKFPTFKLPSVVSTEKTKEFKDVDSADFKGKWNVVFFYPLDFTFVCPTELAEFSREIKSFRDREANVYSVSCDSQFVHLAWRTHNKDLANLQYPMIADYKKELSEELGILHPTDKVPLRATFIVDPDGIIRWVSVNDLNVGRNVKEVIRVLDALQTDELCPCNWEKGKETLHA
jgi:alkyl hydroperoxide reductase subunit AhpC